MDKTLIKPENIRNFCIIAHIDHGKSTLADRLLELTKTIEKRDLKEQTLDSLDLEKERGITIKLKPVRMEFVQGNENYELNLIDTPGHVDFSYEVSRSLAACEGAVLVVDATQGIQAQTVSNVYKALDANLTIIPVLNKIDLPSSDVEKVTNDLVQTFGFSRDEILKVSAKTGEGVLDLISEIIKRIPAPVDNSHKPLRALIFDSFYDSYLGVVAVVKVVDGKISKSEIERRKELKFFAKTHINSNGGDNFKSVILLNADKLTIDAQSALRRCIELFNHTTRFFIIVEDKYKLLKPILSRFCEIYIPEPTIHKKEINLYEHILNKTFNLKESKNQKNEWLKKFISKNMTSDLTHEKLINHTTKLYEKGYSGLDLIEYIEKNEINNVTEIKKYELLFTFNKIRKEFRNEKILILFILNFVFLSLECNLENISFM